jgi:DNA-binding MarR family transcriptional regulator
MTPDRLTEIRYLILAAQRQGSRMLADGLRARGLTPAQAEVLDVLAHHAPMTLAELGRLLVCETGSPSRLVDSLVQRGLVAREPGRQDKRVVQLDLTGDGRALLAGETADATIDETAGRPVDANPVEAFVAARLTDDEAAQLAGLLRKLLHDTPAGRALEIRFAAKTAAT